MSDTAASQWDDVDPDEDEPPLRLGPKRKADDEMDITPMIDITFLLLIFFLVASKMDPNNANELPDARNGVAVVEKNSIVFLVSAGSEDQAIVKRGDGQEFSKDLEQQEQEIADYVQKEMQAGSKDSILIMADKGVRYREVDRVARAIGDATEEGRRLNLAVKEVH